MTGSWINHHEIAVHSLGTKTIKSVIYATPFYKLPFGVQRSGSPTIRGTCFCFASQNVAPAAAATGGWTPGSMFGNGKRAKGEAWVFVPHHTPSNFGGRNIANSTTFSPSHRFKNLIEFARWIHLVKWRVSWADLLCGWNITSPVGWDGHWHGGIVGNVTIVCRSIQKQPFLFLFAKVSKGLANKKNQWPKSGHRKMNSCKTKESMSTESSGKKHRDDK